MRQRQIALAPLLAVLLLCTGACLSQQDYRRWMAWAYAPATLAREDLFLTFSRKEVRVRAVFHFTTTEDSRPMTCLFPGAAWPLVGNAATVFPVLPAAPRQFTAAVDDRPVAVTIDEAGDFRFPVAFRRTGTQVVTAYRSDYAIDHAGRRLFAYILHTGAHWRGPIGVLHLSVETAPGLTVRRLSPATIPTGPFEPDEDLLYEVQHGRQP